MNRFPLLPLIAPLPLMKHHLRERVFAVLQHREPDRVPSFEIWIDALLDELGQAFIEWDSQPR
jgi:hypothetical protein